MDTLRPVDSVEVFSLVDNALEMLYHVARDDVQRPGQWLKEGGELPMAEHGFAALVRTHVGSETHTLLFDTGPRPGIVVENARRLTLDLGDVEAVVISHLHWDHHEGLLSALEAIGRPDVPVLLHSNMHFPVGFRDNEGKIHEGERPPFPSAEAIRAAGGAPRDSAAPTLIASDTVLVTGEITRRTTYESGYPGMVVQVNGAWQSYDSIPDERAIVMNVRACGLVVITGCGHAGVVNTLWQARALTGEDRLYMVMGGFHLAGKTVETRILQTVRDVAALDPALIVPCHCTGFPAAMAFAEALPRAFVANSVGNRYVVGDADRPQPT